MQEDRTKKEYPKRDGTEIQYSLSGNGQSTSIARREEAVMVYNACGGIGDEMSFDAVRYRRRCH